MQGRNIFLRRQTPLSPVLGSGKIFELLIVTGMSQIMLDTHTQVFWWLGLKAIIKYFSCN